MSQSLPYHSLLAASKPLHKILWGGTPYVLWFVRTMLSTDSCVEQSITSFWRYFAGCRVARWWGFTEECKSLEMGLWKLYLPLLLDQFFPLPGHVNQPQSSQQRTEQPFHALLAMANWSPSETRSWKDPSPFSCFFQIFLLQWQWGHYHSVKTIIYIVSCSPTVDLLILVPGFCEHLQSGK